MHLEGRSGLRSGGHSPVSREESAATIAWLSKRMEVGKTKMRRRKRTGGVCLYRRMDGRCGVLEPGNLALVLYVAGQWCN